jgi:hypothetical protein
MATTRFLFGSNRTVAVSVLLAVLLFLMLWATLHPRRSKFVQVRGEGELRSHVQSTGDVAFTLRPGAFYSFRFVVPNYHTDASLTGQFSVTGQDGNGIEAFVLNEKDYTSWRDGCTTYRYYDSGCVEQGSMDLPLLDAGLVGAYYVVFNNGLPAAAADNVKAKMTLVYYTRWWRGVNE